MKRVIVFLILLSTVFAPQCVGRKGSAQADSNRILPSSGKAVTSIGVFGGSLSVKPESNVGKQYWADVLKAKVTSYGVGEDEYLKYKERHPHVIYLPNGVDFADGIHTDDHIFFEQYGRLRA